MPGDATLVPTLSNLGLILLAALLGAIGVRRRRSGIREAMTSKRKEPVRLLSAFFEALFSVCFIRSISHFWKTNTWFCFSSLRINL